MATLHTYICPDCGYEVQCNPAGYDALSSGIIINFLCENCKEIVSVSAKSFTDFSVKCPLCGSQVTSTWNPIEGHCPKCGGAMVEDEETIIMAD